MIIQNSTIVPKISVCASCAKQKLQEIIAKLSRWTLRCSAYAVWPWRSGREAESLLRMPHAAMRLDREMP